MVFKEVRHGSHVLFDVSTLEEQKLYLYGAQGVYGGEVIKYKKGVMCVFTMYEARRPSTSYTVRAYVVARRGVRIPPKST